MNRRSFLKLSALTGAARYVPAGFVSPHWMKPKWIPKAFWDDPSSPAMTPFVAPLPLPPVARRSRRFSAQCSPESITPPASKRPRFHRMVMEEALVSFHPSLPDTAVWRYRDSAVPAASYPWALGPTFKSEVERAALVRLKNNLPTTHVGFGVTDTSMHLHGAHAEARSDGFPDAITGFDPVVDTSEVYPYCYALRDPGFGHGAPDPDDRPSTLWYHDHRLDFTGANVMRGLAGMHLVFDDLDADDENAGLQLPAGDYDVPLVLQDRLFAADGSLCYTPGTFNGFLGDSYCVNGAVQPFFAVKRRKYRFRILNGSNARFYKLALTDGTNNSHPFDQIATDGSLLSSTLRDVGSLLIGMGEREEIVIDFAQVPEGTELSLEDLLNQSSPTGPGGTVANPTCVPIGSGTRAMKFIVGGDVPDPSKVPDLLRPLSPVGPTAGLPTRTFAFDRVGGVWTINGAVVDIDNPVATVPRNSPAVWTFRNGSPGSWWHPVHVHHEFMRVLSRNGGAPLVDEADGLAKKDVILLGVGDEVDVHLNFRDFTGPFMFHCHNLEHEDHYMMARFDVV